MMCDAVVPWLGEEHDEASVGSILGESQRFPDGSYVALSLGVVKESLSPGQDLVIGDSDPKSMRSDTLAFSSCWCIFGLSDCGVLESLKPQ